MEKTLLDTVHLFAIEARRMQNRIPGSGLTLALRLKQPGRYDSDEQKVELDAHFYDGRNYQDVSGASLGALMDECYRRVGWTDITARRIEAVENSLKALPSPDIEG